MLHRAPFTRAVSLSELLQILGLHRTDFYVRVMPRDPPRFQSKRKGKLTFPLEPFLEWYASNFATGVWDGDATPGITVNRGHPRRTAEVG